MLLHSLCVALQEVYAAVHSETNGKVAKSVLVKMYDELVAFDHSIVYKSNFDSLLDDQREVIMSGRRRGGSKRSRPTTKEPIPAPTTKSSSSQVSLPVSVNPPVPLKAESPPPPPLPPSQAQTLLSSNGSNNDHQQHSTNKGHLNHDVTSQNGKIDMNADRSDGHDADDHADDVDDDDDDELPKTCSKRIKLEHNKTCGRDEKAKPVPSTLTVGPPDRIVVWAQPESGDDNEEEEEEEEGPRGSVARDETAKKEEEFGTLFFEVVRNDGNILSLEKLLALKNIFGRQLPKMPKDYISRLVFDHNHRSMVGYKGNRVVGGITFRPFFDQGFGEIAFCAIIGTEQVKGYGTRLMNHLKDYCQGIRVFRFLTYADNHATNYFKKQGFSKEITLDEAKYKGYIKDYDGGTLMECVLRPKIPYLDVPGMLRQQRAAVYEKMKEISNSHIVHPGLSIFKEGGKLTSIDQIPGLREAGFRDEDIGVSGAANERSKKEQKILRKILAQLKDHEDAWPFLQPVDRDDAPDYDEIITEPMDLSTIETRLEDNYYRTRDIFVSDLRLMFNNCRTYNHSSTPYYRCADNLERYFKDIMRRVTLR